jgi:flagellar basal-body rod modification protein FlgD
MTAAIAPLTSTGTTSTDTATTKADQTATADRFLKLLVAQMQNQDPLNPMDNAQVTSQMAQINTVNGIEKLNTTMQSMSTQLMQSQVVQGASLVGHDVVVPGNKLSYTDLTAQGGFELGSSADSVKVEILDAGGIVKDTIVLGKLEAGTHGFDWPAADTAAALKATNFKVTATLANGSSVTTTSLMKDRVNAISTAGDSMTLQLQNSGRTPYASVRELN